MDRGNGKEKKQINKARIVRFILKKGRTSRPEIATELNLSMPTVLQNMKELTDAGIVAEVGEYQSTGGRKAKVISAVADLKYAVGIDITANHISYVMVNFTGELVDKFRKKEKFVDSVPYYRALAEELEKFIDASCAGRDKILGVGISLPGIIDESRGILARSHILNLNEINLKTISQFIDHEVCFENDANSAALAELGGMDQNAVYLSLSNTVGGAVCLDNRIYRGDHYRSAEFGHLVIEHGGRRCYCGKSGCVDAYCSAKVLSRCCGDSLEEFFQRLDGGDAAIAAVWEEYLDYLAVTVNNLRVMFDCHIILGGYVGGYIGGYLLELAEKVKKYQIFDRDTFYLKACRYQREASAVGIAKVFIEKYIGQMS